MTSSKIFGTTGNVQKVRQRENANLFFENHWTNSVKFSTQHCKFGEKLLGLSPEHQFVNTHPLFGFQLVDICPFGRQIFSTKLWQVDKPLSTVFNRFERYKFYFLNVNKLQTPNSNRTNRIFPRKYLGFYQFSTVSTPPTTTTILFLYFLYP